ncbi:hypothetical protein NIES2100_05090 [Calothrix sp. NIES-2100]|uniref:hypothetical protein n=1 Tax=Calothrix sp. NIES-2100 TaxID=1954172 RepID=UPI000B5E39D8|nr:hypothetical protein NIES2100_05090 [Calothrix sp. NIES-2100]
MKIYKAYLFNGIVSFEKVEGSIEVELSENISQAVYKAWENEQILEVMAEESNEEDNGQWWES